MSDKKNTEDELAGTEQPFVQHLMELRDRLLRAVYGIAGIFTVLAFFPGPSRLYDLLAMPLVRALPEGSKMIAVGVVSPFLVPIKVTVLAAVGLSLPWILYQIWAFVAPGLYKHEKKLVLPLVAASTLLFYMGAAFCYFVVFGQAFPAIQKMAPVSVAVTPDIEAAVLTQAGFDPVEFMALIAEPTVKEQLKDNTARAVTRGVFGVPTFFVGEDMFFGQDRLDFVAEAVASA